MAFTLDSIVPWGRSYEEYVAMFALTENDLQKRIVGCGDGPAGFNCVLTRQGGRIVSVDPLYHFSRTRIKNRVDETCREVLEQTRKNQHEFIWKNICSVDELGRTRMQAMEAFLDDYDGKGGGQVY